MQSDIRLRPSKWIVLPAGGVAVGLSGYFLSFLDWSEPWEYVTGIALMTASVLAFANYMWFHYISIGSNELRLVRYFGLGKASVPFSKLTRIGSRPFAAAFGLASIPTVRFCWSGGMVELNPNAYDKHLLKRAVERMKKLGVPVDPVVIREYGLK